MTRNITKALFLITAAALLSCSSAGVKKLDNGQSVFSGSTGRPDAKSSIRGLVIDSVKGRAIEGARVEIKNANMGVGYYLRKTDRRGRFSVDDFLPHINYVIEVSADGFVTHRSTGDIAAGRRTIRLTPEAVLSGTVKDSAGNPLAGVSVKLKASHSRYGSSQRRPLIMETDARGDYSFTKLEHGQYMATFTAPGYITETAGIRNLRAGETFRLPMVMVRPATISGKVLITGLDAPAINVDVTAMGRHSHGTSTYQDGSYRIEDLKPGRYRLKISHQGFYGLTTSTVRVREGAQLTNMNYKVRPREPRAKVYAYRYTFAPGNRVEFNMRTLRLESVRVTIYSVPTGVYMQGGIDPDTLDPEKDGLKTVMQWNEPVRKFQPYQWRYQSVQVKKPLATGGYCVEVRGAGGVMNRKFFTVTSVGVIVKRTRDSIFAYATSLVTNRPVPGARVIVFDTSPKKKKGKRTRYRAPKNFEDLPVQVVMKGKTDMNGIYRARHRSSRYLSLLLVGPDGSYALCNTGAPGRFSRERNKYFIYTDRPVYRAGDTVQYKIIGKTRKNRFVPMSGGRIYYKIVNRDTGSTIEDGTLRLDDWGTACGSITIPKSANLGTHEVRVGPTKKNMYANGRFYVEQYRKPEFRIDLTPARDYFVNGETVEFKVDAKYFFGAPLKNALVRYRFYETRLRDTDTRYWWEEDYQARRSYYRMRLEGEKYVDANGITVLRLFAGDYPYDREITLEATIIDSSNVSITARKKIRVGRGEYYIKILPEKQFYSDTGKKMVEVRTVTHTGKPVRANVELGLYRYVWKPAQRVYVHDKRPLFSKKITTDRKGYARVSLPERFAYHGEFDLIARSRDRRENIITASRVIWVYSPYGASPASRLKNLELVPGRTSLDSPGRVTCLVKSRFTDAYVCLTIEGRDVYESRVVRMKKNIMPVTFDIKGKYAPNLYISAAMQRKRALYTRTAGIALPVKDTGLRIAIGTDKKTYMPGQNIRVDLKATDSNGKPVSADLSLGAVDEAIYQIRPDHTPKMRDFYYSKISNWVLTSYSFPITVLAGAAKEGKVKVREKFEDTAFWKSSIRTGRDGTASVSFKLPDNLTTWRLTARGHDRSGRVGEKKGTFPVTQDLIARIGRPRFFTEGDRVGLIGIVNSNTERGLKSVETEFSVQGRKMTPDRDIRISLPAYGSARNYYSLSVPKDRRDLALRFYARADRKAADSIRVSVPVQKRGVSYKLYGIGDMDRNRAISIEPVKETGDFTFVPEEVTVTVNPSPIVQMLRATLFLSRYPYGCIEQTLNRFIPNLALEQLLEQKGYEGYIDGKARKNLKAKARKGLAIIQQKQNRDGTWGWWSGDRGNEFVTGYVISSLHLAKSAGYSVGDKTVESGIKAINRIMNRSKSADRDALAYLLYVNALWGNWNSSAYEALSGMKKRNPYQLAFMVRAMAASGSIKSIKAGEREKIRAGLPALVSELKQLARKDSRGLYWKSSGSQAWGWPGGDTEITAHVLAALVESGDSSTMPAQIVNSLSKRGRGQAWHTTKQTATVILAMCGFIESRGARPSMKGNLNFTMNGAALADISWDLARARDMRALSKTVSLKGKQDGKSFSVAASGDAGPDTSFEVTLSGTLYFKKKGILSLFKSEERSLDALSNGLSMTRVFYGITRVRDMNRNEYLVPQSMKDRAIIKTGDELLVKVRFTAQEDFEYLVLEDYLPSGFEVVNKNAYGRYQPWVHLERRDNRMVYFFTRIKKGNVYEVAYIVRAELPGEFMTKPTRMECMYEPGIQGWSVPAVIEVKKK